MKKKIVITGATGLIGKHLTQVLAARGDEITVFSTRPEQAKNILPGAANYIKWNAYQLDGWETALEGKDAVIHLAGKSLFGNFASNKYKKGILESRTQGTANLVKAIKMANSKPKTFISASAIGYYGEPNGTPFIEGDPAGIGFLPSVCTKWEKEANEIRGEGVRLVIVRVGVVLDKEEGALKYLLLPFEHYLGGMIGTGEQYISWIHKKDMAELFIHLLDNDEIEGVINGVAPNAVKMNEFVKLLADKVEKPSLLRAPGVMVNAVVGEVSLPVTQGIWVEPKRALESGFRFNYNNLKAALDNLL